MINLIEGKNEFIIYGDFTQNMNNYTIHLFNGFDRLDYICKLQNKTSSTRFAEFTIYINDGIIGNYHLNGLPFGNYDYVIRNSVGVTFNRGQAFLAGDTEVQKIEYISDNEKSESVIYVS
ncbi:MAG: hypothetical protein RLZZ13_411 [Pseudomonadota bacterium]